jgi:hypothetical protein
MAHTDGAYLRHKKRRDGESFGTIAPAGTAGLKSIPVLKLSSDGKSYAYSTFRILSDLFVVDGMK